MRETGARCDWLTADCTGGENEGSFFVYEIGVTCYFHGHSNCFQRCQVIVSTSYQCLERIFITNTFSQFVNQERPHEDVERIAPVGF